MLVPLLFRASKLLRQYSRHFFVPSLQASPPLSRASSNSGSLGLKVNDANSVIMSVTNHFRISDNAQTRVAQTSSSHSSSHGPHGREGAIDRSSISVPIFLSSFWFFFLLSRILAAVAFSCLNSAFLWAIL